MSRSLDGGKLLDESRCNRGVLRSFEQVPTLHMCYISWNLCQSWGTEGRHKKRGRGTISEPGLGNWYRTPCVECVVEAGRQRLCAQELDCK